MAVADLIVGPPTETPHVTRWSVKATGGTRRERTAVMGAWARKVGARRYGFVEHSETYGFLAGTYATYERWACEDQAPGVHVNLAYRSISLGASVHSMRWADVPQTWTDAGSPWQDERGV